MRLSLRIGGGVFVSLSLLLAVPGCVGSTAALRDDKRALEQRVDTLQAKYLRARRTIRDLENRIIVLEDELDEQPALNQPSLPVEVVGPRGDYADEYAGDYGADYEERADARPDEVPGEDLIVEGSPAYEGEVEVVYEGEAARGSGRPSISLNGKLARSAPRTVARPRPARTLERAPTVRAQPVKPAPIPQGPRLDVVAKVPPVPTAGPIPGPGPKPSATPVANSAAADPVRSQVAEARPVQARAGTTAPRRARKKRPRGAPGPAAAEPPVAARSSVDPRAAYKRHYKALRAGQHASAIEGFRAFVAEHPRHDYADNAQYWLGEAFYDQKQFAEALIEFEQVARRFPNGNKVPDAMLKAAFCEQNLGHADRARALLRRIVREHPKTNPAGLAADRLALLSE